MNWLKYRRVSWKNIFISCVFSIILISATIYMPGCSEEETFKEPQIPSHFTTYTDEANLFSISYPPDWKPILSIIQELEQLAKEIIKSIESDTSVEQASIIFAAGVPLETGWWSPNVNIVVELLSDLSMSLDEAVESQVRGIKQYFQDYVEFSRINTIIDGRKATTIEYEASLPDIGKSHSLQMFTFIGKNTWCITCTPTPGEFNESKEDFYAIVRSLRILK